MAGTKGEDGGNVDAVVVVFLVAVFVFVSPLTLLWASAAGPWYTPYLLWGGVILLTVLVDRLRERNGL